MKILKNVAAKAAAASAWTVALSTVAAAAGANTGVQAGFFELGRDLNVIVDGAGGYIILTIGIIFGATMWIITQRFGPVLVSFGAALFLGYGITALGSLASVTATTDLVFSQTTQPAEHVVVETAPHQPLLVQ